MRKSKRGTSTLFLAIILSALILVETTYIAFAADLDRRLTYTRALKEQTEIYLASYDRQLFKTYGIYAFDSNRINTLVFNEILAANGYDSGDVMYASGMYSIDTETLRRAVACYYSYRASGVLFQRFSAQIMYLIGQIGEGGVIGELQEFVSSPAAGLMGRIIDGGADISEAISIAASALGVDENNPAYQQFMSIVSSLNAITNDSPDISNGFDPSDMGFIFDLLEFNSDMYDAGTFFEENINIHGCLADYAANNFDCSDCYSPLLSDQLEQSKQPSAETKLTRTLNVVIDSVDAFCKSNGIFRSSFFTAAYAYLLAKYNNDQQVLFNTVHNGRADKRSNRTVGMLVKTVPVYAKFDGDTRVLDFIKAGEEQMKGCRQHISYNYSDAINDLGLQPATLFVWHGNTLDNNPFCGKPMKFELLCNNSREVSLYLKAFIKDGRFEVEAEYNSNEYSEALIDQFMESYEAVIEGFLSQERLCDINMTTASQMSLLDSFNDTDRPYDETQTVVSLFRRQAKATPDAEAVVFKDHRYTYAEVDEISDRIAGYILSKGLNVGDAVSVIIPRSEWMAIASLGVLKAGCAYQPLDPTYPKERLNFMVQDAEAKLLIADEQLRQLVDEYQGEVLLTKEIENLPALTAEANSSLFTLHSSLKRL